MRKKLKKLLSEKNIFLDLQGCDKYSIIEEMINRLARAGYIKARENALQAVWEREKKMSTGMKHGVAIPHGKTDSVEQLIVAVGLKRGGVEFECSDGEAAKIFIMTISPESRTGPHIQFLAEVAKILNSREARSHLLSAETVEDVLDVFI